MNKKTKLLLVIFTTLLIAFFSICKYFYQDPLYLFKPGIKIQNTIVTSDKDEDGLNDAADLVAGARLEVQNKTTYKSAYYVGGYAPTSEGVCTDVVIRAMLAAGYNLKDSMDADIAKNLSSYARTITKPDPNIDFRRVRNQFIYFNNNVKNLTTEVKPYNKANLQQWQPGDIVLLKNSDHVGIISDKRRKDGVPFVIHNSYPRAKENDRLMQWYVQDRIIGHYRIY